MGKAGTSSVLNDALKNQHPCLQEMHDCLYSPITAALLDHLLSSWGCTDWKAVDRGLHRYSALLAERHCAILTHVSHGSVAHSAGQRIAVAGGHPVGHEGGVGLSLIYDPSTGRALIRRVREGSRAHEFTKRPSAGARSEADA
eukprot:3357763-Rhodomonas_salina.3